MYSFFVIGALLAVIVCVSGFTFIVETPDAIITNSAIFSAYISLIMKHFWQSLNTLEFLRVRSLQSEGVQGTISELLSSIMTAQKRISNYLTSFILNSNYNIDGFME